MVTTRFAKDGKRRCKRPSFSVRLTAFRSLKDGLLQTTWQHAENQGITSHIAK